LNSYVKETADYYIANVAAATTRAIHEYTQQLVEMNNKLDQLRIKSDETIDMMVKKLTIEIMDNWTMLFQKPEQSAERHMLPIRSFERLYDLIHNLLHRTCRPDTKHVWQADERRTSYRISLVSCRPRAIFLPDVHQLLGQPDFPYMTRFNSHGVPDARWYNAVEHCSWVQFETVFWGTLTPLTMQICTDWPWDTLNISSRLALLHKKYQAKTMSACPIVHVHHVGCGRIEIRLTSPVPCPIEVVYTIRSLHSKQTCGIVNQKLNLFPNEVMTITHLGCFHQHGAEFNVWVPGSNEPCFSRWINLTLPDWSPGPTIV